MKAPLSFEEEKKQERIRRRAEREAHWFFEVMGGRVPEPGVGPEYARPAAEAIDRWFRSIPPFHRGALSLLYDEREWSPVLRREFGQITSLVVRLAAAWLADGRPPGELEAAAVLELEEEIAACQRPRRPEGDTHRRNVFTRRARKVWRRSHRALEYIELALRAYAKARGDAPCVLPPELQVARPYLAGEDA
jgi:hypothetical protein